MLAPTVLRVVRPFFGFGSGPAVSLTQSVPQGVDADILLLGSEDIRDILYTAYHEKGLREFSALVSPDYMVSADRATATRKLDITSCDAEDATIGTLTQEILSVQLLTDLSSQCALLDFAGRSA